ncbi:DUF1217 domain-containing protein [Cognatiyoonia sp. IB215182]|uniref:DUF1217 domain-containing protein n=1 Tax=Cognatiyoonia sp. IB215182 TaxID=3097353 RepID=UPI002A150BBD|nr:DUF1217 domain-containing protein [Cognatiyoonia sp. IB215182]MDX8352865.1 DUF1217 domain-containing protein [Cognatiyoonia sp. IB215182]
MSFQPVVPLSGYVGWRFLERTFDAQQTAFSESQPITRATDYFRENIGNVRTAEDLVSDRQLLSVALGAYGLDDDIDNRFFIRKILEDGTIDDDALANRLADNRYAEFSRAFGFGDQPVPRTSQTSFVDDVVARFEARQFERAVGEQDNDLRLAMNVSTGLSDILNRNSTPTGQWFSVMGNAPLRNVFETALGLPSSIASIDLDQQLEVFQDRSRTVLGTDDLSVLADPAEQEKLIRLFLVRAEAAEVSVSSGASAALTLLQSAPQVIA